MKISKSLLGLSLVIAMSGCSGLQDCFDEHCNSMHTGLTGMEAWARWSWCYNELVHPKDFASGFRAGYQDVLNGGSGCQPTLPPKTYWKACYRNAEGNCKVNAWFEGFSHGVLAANQDGAASYGSIPLSPTAQANWETSQQPPAEYDWSGTTTPPAPMSSTTTDSDFAPLPVEPAPAAPVAPEPPVPTPARDYENENEAAPILEKALETTGRFSLPNLGG